MDRLGIHEIAGLTRYAIAKGMVETGAATKSALSPDRVELIPPARGLPAQLVQRAHLTFHQQ